MNESKYSHIATNFVASISAGNSLFLDSELNSKYDSPSAVWAAVVVFK